MKSSAVVTLIMFVTEVSSFRMDKALDIIKDSRNAHTAKNHGVIDGNINGNGDDNCVDVAVIGAGIGGAYTAWRLKDKGLSVSVFEYTDRVGGRLLSVQLPVAPGTHLELGGMRFSTSDHPILTKTVTEVGLKIIDFPEMDHLPEESIWHVRGKSLRNTDFETTNMPYNLDPAEMKPKSLLLWDTCKRHLNFSGDTYPSLEEMYSLVTEDGIPVYKMSLDNFYGRYESREMYNFIRDTGTTIDEAGFLNVFKNADFPGDGKQIRDYKTVEDGMDRVPQELMKKFLRTNKRHMLHLNKQLESIRKEGGHYHLEFLETETNDGITKVIEKKMKMCADKVVLAVNKAAVENIDFPAFMNNPEFVENLNSVFDRPAGKIFLAYKDQWWNQNNKDITYSISDLPNGETYNWYTSNNVTVVLASYHTGSSVNYWRELRGFGAPITGSLPGPYAVTDFVKERAEKYLSVIFNVPQEDIPEAVGGGMMLWDNAWSVFKPGYDERKVREMMYKPSPSDDVHIVSNSWARGPYFSWSEGTLQAVDHVISKYFG